MKKFSKAKVISEIGCNHMGDFEIAKELVRMSKDAGADIVKLQKRNNKELLTEEQYNQPHPNPDNSYGNTYGEHREYLEFDFLSHVPEEERNVERIIDDFVLLTFLVGNDFLPHLPTLDIGEHAFHLLFDIFLLTYFLIH